MRGYILPNKLPFCFNVAKSIRIIADKSGDYKVDCVNIILESASIMKDS